MCKVLICGPFPEPIGGISIHIQRLTHLVKQAGLNPKICDESSTTKPGIFNIRSLNLLTYLKLVYQAEIIHIHSSVGVFRLTHLISAFILRKKIIVTIHSWRKGCIASWLWSKTLNLLSTKVILVSEDIATRIRLPKLKQIFFPAFIPSIASPEELPAGILHFINNAIKNRKKIISSNAFRIVNHNNQELYGLDLCIDAFSDIEISKSAVLIFSISDPSVNIEKIENYQKTINDRNLSSVIYIQLGAINFYSLLSISDISIRATNTDGDALSVRESLFLNKPCIASDCTKRPEGVLLFENRSATSLAKIISNQLRTPAPVIEQNDNASKIENFYLNLYKGIQ
ncbi:hypothetical protein [Pseudomonas sp. RL_5y_Pfl2_69]|uniref:hypothetical protein n=1 Tax=Pseudomonas sp. RL_5y_Pfl2_69 TaxID=3088711 RepID=UPI0030DD2A93